MSSEKSPMAPEGGSAPQPLRKYSACVYFSNHEPGADDEDTEVYLASEVDNRVQRDLELITTMINHEVELEAAVATLRADIDRLTETAAHDYAALALTNQQLRDTVATLTRERDELKAIDAENRDIACNLEERQLWVVSGLRASMSLSAWCRWCGVVREAVKEGRVDHLPWCATKTGNYPRLDVIADLTKHLKELQDELKAAKAGQAAGAGAGVCTPEQNTQIEAQIAHDAELFEAGRQHGIAHYPFGAGAGAGVSQQEVPPRAQK